jgi:ABC-2 type transport system ATP-binding protein
VTDAIVVDELTKSFGDFVAVDRVSFRVRTGEIFGFLGPNGAGKTTTIRILLGLLTPTSGKASVLGLDIVSDVRELHTRVGYMSQLFTLYNDLTAWENIRFYGRAYGLTRGQLLQRRDEILEMAGLSDRANTLTAALSGGWRQRLALGCAIIHHPRLVFLDEPTAGVDPISRRDFWELIHQLAKGGTTVLVTTHYMDEADHCQRLGFISGGQIAALGSPQELKSTLMARRSVVEIDAAEPEKAMKSLRSAQRELGLSDLAFYGSHIHVVVDDATNTIPDITDFLEGMGVVVERVSPIAPSLEDVFITRIRGHNQSNSIP